MAFGGFELKVEGGMYSKYSYSDSTLIFHSFLNHVGVIFPQIWGKLSNGWFLDLLRLEG